MVSGQNYRGSSITTLLTRCGTGSGCIQYGKGICVGGREKDGWISWTKPKLIALELMSRGRSHYFSF